MFPWPLTNILDEVHGSFVYGKSGAFTRVQCTQFVFFLFFHFSPCFFFIQLFVLYIRIDDVLKIGRRCMLVLNIFSAHTSYHLLISHMHSNYQYKKGEMSKQFHAIFFFIRSTRFTNSSGLVNKENGKSKTHSLKIKPPLCI